MERSQPHKSKKKSATSASQDKLKPTTAGMRDSTQQVAKDIRSQLTKHEEIDTSQVSIQVNDDKVHLHGNVDNAHAKSLTCQIAEQEVLHSDDKVSSEQLTYRRENSQAPDESAVTQEKEKEQES